MPTPDRPFSKRYGYRSAPDITVREDAPEAVRSTVLAVAKRLDWGPTETRQILCAALRVRPDAGNWSRDNVRGEIEALAYGCEWFKFYDFVEALHAAMLQKDLEHGRHGTAEADAPQLAQAVNEAFIDEGVGWQLVDGQIITRGAEAFEATVTTASAELHASGRPTSAHHIHDALAALSRRPTADLSGAVYHAMGALEAVARDVVDDEKSTLGEILKRHPDLVPPPLDIAISKIWGYASNEARHVVEGRAPTREDAELVVGLAAAVATYLSRRKPR